jgi:putative transposase
MSELDLSVAVEANVPKNIDVHVILDNYAPHMHLVVRRWSALGPWWNVDYTLTFSSSLSQVEIWFNVITQQAIRRGTFAIAKELILGIKEHVKHYNKQHKPSVWMATADSIFAKRERV